MLLCFVSRISMISSASLWKIRTNFSRLYSTTEGEIQKKISIFFVFSEPIFLVSILCVLLSISSIWYSVVFLLFFLIILFTMVHQTNQNQETKEKVSVCYSINPKKTQKVKEKSSGLCAKSKWNNFSILNQWKFFGSHTNYRLYVQIIKHHISGFWNRVFSCLTIMIENSNTPWVQVRLLEMYFFFLTVQERGQERFLKEIGETNNFTA